MKRDIKNHRILLNPFILLLAIILSIPFIVFVHSSRQNDSSVEFSTHNLSQNISTVNSPKKSNITITLTAIGDILCHNTQYWDAYDQQTDTYDFSYVFKDICHYFENTDISIGSLETSFAGKERGFSNYPTFNSPDNLAFSLKQAGLDILSTAGNHCLDMGFSGLSRTIDILNDAKLSHLGTYQTPEDRDTILFQNVNGIKIAFINYTYGTNGIPIPSEKEFCVNLIDRDLIKKDIIKAKSQNADLIISCMHWGTEYKTTANSEQMELADFLFQNGVDIILGNHPHVLEPMEKRTITLEDGTKKDGFVIYALGNFICDQNAENTRNSIILNLTITKHTNNKISIDSANYVPIYMYKEDSSNLKRMKLLDIRKTLTDYEAGTNTFINQKTYDDLKIQLEKIQNIVGPEITQ